MLGGFRPLFALLEQLRQIEMGLRFIRRQGQRGAVMNHREVRLAGIVQAETEAELDCGAVRGDLSRALEKRRRILPITELVASLEGGRAQREKHQTPNSKLQKSSKLQTPTRFLNIEV